MLRKILVIDGGDTEMLPGIKVDVIDFTDANEKALLAGKRPAIGVPRILGITKAALDTSSFLSSASFQETTKVLTDAAIKCKVDYLRGMKENVMIGKLIPAVLVSFQKMKKKKKLKQQHITIPKIILTTKHLIMKKNLSLMKTSVIPMIS